MKLNLGCGNRREDGYVNIDIVKTAATDQIVNLFQFPWPWHDGDVDEIFAAHFFEHVPSYLRFEFMDECYRVLKPGGIVRFIVPYYSSVSAIQDPTHEWPPLCEMSFMYFDKKWRKEMKLDHYDVMCDFEPGFGFMPSEYANLPDDEEVSKEIVRHKMNVIELLYVTLKRRDDETGG